MEIFPDASADHIFASTRPKEIGADEPRSGRVETSAPVGEVSMSGLMISVAMNLLVIVVFFIAAVLVAVGMLGIH